MKIRIPRPRGIFAKLLMVFVIIGVVPFIAMAVWTYDQARDRMTQTVIEHWLVRLSREVAVQIDQEVLRMRGLVHGWAADHGLAALVNELQSPTTDLARKQELRDYLSNCMKTRGDIDLVLVVAMDGRILGSVRNAQDGPQPTSLTGAHLEDLPRRSDDDPSLRSECEWIEGAFQLGQGPEPLSARDWHLSRLLALARDERIEPGARPTKTAAYDVGFAGSLTLGPKSASVGVIAVLFNLSPVQRVIDNVTQRFMAQEDTGGIRGRYRTGYPFLFASDANTVIAHKYQQNLGLRLEQDFKKGVFRSKILAAPYGSHRYDYPRRNPKIAGFAHCAGHEDRGFGWIIGVGIDSQDIYADVIMLRDFLLVWSVVVCLLVVLVAFVLSHRITKPLLRLSDHTRLVAAGDLDARVDLATGDEITTLGEAFNAMAGQLKETNRKLIKAEKDAAWREMARQVAHEIKNPLTPIMLSAQQVEQARKDRHPMYDDIVADSMSSIIEQCRSLKKIASDFMAYARLGGGERKAVPLRALLEQALKPYAALEDTRGIRLAIDTELPETAAVSVVPEDLQRVLNNLLNNAIESMGSGGGQVVVRAERETRGEEEWLRVQVQDDGCGIPAEHLGQLFEPSFSTRTGGTGLGLAIAKKIVVEHGGTLEARSTIGVGTTMTLRLPLAEG